MLSFTLTILRIGSQECWDKATATLNNSMIAGVVYQLLIPPAKQRSFQNVLDSENNKESARKI
jgi:predicted phage tail protein